MVHRITLISDEVEDFILELLIDADATFYDLHKLIVESCRYDEAPSARFLICDEDWECERVIHLTDNGSCAVDEDVYLMDEMRLGDVLEDEDQRLRYVFDPVGERAFLMEVTEIRYGEHVDAPVCKRRRGEAPMQFQEEDGPIAPETTRAGEELDEDFYGSEGFDTEEFDPEGFEIEERNA